MEEARPTFGNQMSNPTSPTGARKKSRDQLIHEYVQAARERIESNPNTNRDQSAALVLSPPLSTERSGSRPSPQMRSASQWPLPKGNPEVRGAGTRLQNELAPHSERAPRHLHQPQPQRGAPMLGSQSYGDYQGRSRPRAAPESRFAYNGGPPPRDARRQQYSRGGFHQQQFRSQRAPTVESRYSARGDNAPRRDYIPPANVQSGHFTSTPSPIPTIKAPPSLSVPPPRRPGMQQIQPNSSIPAIAEEIERRASLQPSVSDSGTSDVLNDYYRADSRQSERSVRDGPYIAEATTARPSVARAASFGQLQKPTLTMIRTPSTSREAGPAIQDKDSFPVSEPSDHRIAEPDVPTHETLPTGTFLAEATPPQTFPPETPPEEGLKPLHDIASQLRISRSLESIPSLKSRGSTESFKTATLPTSPAPLMRSESPTGQLQSRFRHSDLAEPEQMLADGALEPPRAYFAAAPSSSTVDLVEKSEKPAAARQPVAEEGGATDARASVTSLPGLIHRALRLASNLERGKTSSKFGIDWMLNADQPKSEKRKSEMSLKSMLHSFPDTPGQAQQWPKGTGQHSALRHSQVMSQLPSDPNDTVTRKRKRTCCFMPLWLFLLVLAILILIILAAILIPVFLIVTPHHNHQHSTAAALAACSASHPCAHSGTSTLTTSNTCSCTCTNGWTGAGCNAQDTTGCVSSTLGGTNATIGSAIPRLVTVSSSGNVHLNATALFAAFDGADLSCAGQNALVTFDGLTARSVPRKERRQAQTENGIVFAGTSTAAAPSPTSSTAVSGSVTATATAATTTSTATSGPSAQTLDFARVAVLYVLQVSGELNTAVGAQNVLSGYFARESGDAGALDLGSGFTANLVNGTVVDS